MKLSTSAGSVVVGKTTALHPSAGALVSTASWSRFRVARADERTKNESIFATIQEVRFALTLIRLAIPARGPHAALGASEHS